MTFKAFLCSGLLVGAIKYYEQERMVDEPNRTDPVQSQIDDLIQNLPWVGANTHSFTIIVPKIFRKKQAFPLNASKNGAQETKKVPASNSKFLPN